MKPHVFAQMVNEVRDLAKQYGHMEQFRCRVADLLKKYIPVEHGKEVPGVVGTGVRNRAQKALARLYMLDATLPRGHYPLLEEAKQELESLLGVPSREYPDAP